MILRDERIWKQFFTAPMSEFFESYYTSRGVRFAKQSGIKELHGDGMVTAATLADGKSIPCQLVVAGIGVTPVTDLLTDSGIRIENGVLANEYLETNISGIFAAGDVANYEDVIFQKRRRAEHWDNAVSQGQHCAKTLMGERAVFKHVPYFFSDVFDLSYEFWGDTSGADATIYRGDVRTKSFSTWWLKKNTVVAAFVMNRPDEERTVAPQWIESRKEVSAVELGASESLQGAVAISH
jgi:NADPH-dependent 2,4-dienoyl-CoA reductase/sulfur reductase-like enzyme